MRQATFDLDHAEAFEILAWLAELPCPKEWDTVADFVGLNETVEMHPAGCICRGTGLAFPWVSEKCLACHRVAGHLGHRIGCNGSGRVPKDVGLELLMQNVSEVTRWDILDALESEVVRGGTDFTQAAFRAVAKGLTI